ncbi:trehalose-phosphatase [Sphingomonas sp. KR1UV-12]|uniref:Trehalose 6-phosphate phosphatase n=1 Tax=Sphingomonas aurea TaxID=3063994 RepID=A0ABT9EG48_9SPHN|nr:trehalose-phosphatase [Sphingomonas sp. KR1UV-12]MDP1025598.1 trehalose-phosphatase [Sphingomonas sp. KR1UV-12]
MSSSPVIDLDPPPHPDLATASLFFDFDGTLVELAPTPDGVVVDDRLRDRLARLAKATNGRVAIVTGRSIAQIDTLMGHHAAGLAIAGSHGAEWRTERTGHVTPQRSEALESAAAELRAFADLEGLLFEAKSLGVTLHYRQCPDREADTVAMAERVADRFGLQANRGKMMVEVRLPGDKGRAITTLMDDAALRGTTPWFFGDDVTDEDGFAAAQALGGAGVLIDPPRATAAAYRLDDVAALRDWIDAVLAAAEAGTEGAA